MIAWIMGAIGYVCGSIPSGVLIARWLSLQDPRCTGSGNIGSTNLFRIGGCKPGLIVFLCDFFKAFVPTGIVYIFFDQDTALLTGFFCVVGHIFSIWLKFSGGKGIATAYGVLVALFPMISLFGLFLWIIIWKISHYISLASLISIWAMVGGIYWFYPEEKIKILMMGILITYAHKNNLLRLIKGNEPKTWLK